jgi:hypothetical protein
MTPKTILNPDTATPRCYQVATPASVAGLYRSCAWCGKPFKGTAFERHHWLLARSALPKKLFPVLNVLANVVPLHHSCHSNYGQTDEMRTRCLRLAVKVLGLEQLQGWYASLRSTYTIPYLDELEHYVNK